MSRSNALVWLALPTLVCYVLSQSDDFIYSSGPVPKVFRVEQHYPSRSEEEECRPLRLRIERGSTGYYKGLVFNQNQDVVFASEDSKLMTSRMFVRLNSLAEQWAPNTLTVLKAWSEYEDPDLMEEPFSLHYEGQWGG